MTPLETMRNTEAAPESDRWHPSMKRRMSVCYYGLCFGIALPLAAFTANGLLGLIVHGIALSGAASFFEKQAPLPQPGDVP